MRAEPFPHFHHGGVICVCGAPQLAFGAAPIPIASIVQLAYVTASYVTQRRCGFLYIIILLMLPGNVDGNLDRCPSCFMILLLYFTVLILNSITVFGREWLKERSRKCAIMNLP